MKWCNLTIENARAHFWEKLLGLVFWMKLILLCINVKVFNEAQRGAACIYTSVISIDNTWFGGAIFNDYFSQIISRFYIIGAQKGRLHAVCIVYISASVRIIIYRYSEHVFFPSQRR